MNADMTAVTTQSNRTVWNEVKDNWVLLEPFYGKKTNKIFGQSNKNRTNTWYSNSTSGYLSEEKIIWKDICILMFIAA